MWNILLATRFGGFYCSITPFRNRSASMAVRGYARVSMATRLQSSAGGAQPQQRHGAALSRARHQNHPAQVMQRSSGAMDRPMHDGSPTPEQCCDLPNALTFLQVHSDGLSRLR